MTPEKDKETCSSPDQPNEEYSIEELAKISVPIQFPKVKKEEEKKEETE